MMEEGHERAVCLWLSDIRRLVLARSGNKTVHNSGRLLQFASTTSHSGEGDGTLLAMTESTVAARRQDLGNGKTANKRNSTQRS